MIGVGGGDVMQPVDFVPIYKEIAQIIGVEQTLELYENMRGQQVTFPQRLYNTTFVSQYVKQNYNGKNMRELAQKFNYSERRIREFLK